MTMQEKDRTLVLNCSSVILPHNACPLFYHVHNVLPTVIWPIILKNDSESTQSVTHFLFKSTRWEPTLPLPNNFSFLSCLSSILVLKRNDILSEIHVIYYARMYFISVSAIFNSDGDQSGLGFFQIN